MVVSFPTPKGIMLVTNPSRKDIKLSINSFLPGITIMSRVPSKMKLLLLSHFLTCSSQLFVSVYATLWSGITMLEDGSQQYNKAIRNIVFDIGISWGNTMTQYI
jgi:solute carrier family 45 protein 1/2/4